MASLITPPPSIFGGVVPHPGMAPTSIDTLLINGTTGWTANLGDALISINISFKIDGTSTVTVVVEDQLRTLLRSVITQQKSVITIDGVRFVLANVEKSVSQMTLVFEHAVCSALKDHTETVVAAANTISRTGFVKKLVSTEGWISVETPAGASPGLATSQLANGNVTTKGAPKLPTDGVINDPPETFWDTAQTVLDVIGWRRFPKNHNTLLVVPDSYLYSQKPLYSPKESDAAVDSIDFNRDTRLPLGELTLTVRSEAWAWPVGSVVSLGSDMGIAKGNWLVTDIERALTDAQATITCDTPRLTIPEPQKQTALSQEDILNNQIRAEQGNVSVSSYGGQTAQTNNKPNSKINDFVNFARSKAGLPYVYGTAGPNSYDCSGLVMAAAASIGITLPHNSQAIYELCVAKNGGAIDVQTGFATYGALLVISPEKDGATGHIAISLGNGTQTMEATGVAQGIGIYNNTSQSRFDLACLLPGVTY